MKKERESKERMKMIEREREGGEERRRMIERKRKFPV